MIARKKLLAIAEVGSALRLCQQHNAPRGMRLLYRRGPQLHTLIGLYPMSMNTMFQAESQFKLALKLLDQQSSRTTIIQSQSQPQSHATLQGSHCSDQTIPGNNSNASITTASIIDIANQGQPTTLHVFIMPNLALVHVRQNKIADCKSVLHRINSEASAVLNPCYCLQAANFYVHSFLAFCERRYQDGKSFLRAVLRMTNLEDLNRLTSSGLMTLGQIFMNMNN